MADFDIKKFVNPPKSARPMARWWWPGLDVDKDELLREVADMDEANFAGGEIQAFTDGVPIEMKADPEVQKRLNRYRTDYYFQAVTAVLEEMKKRGLILDLTACSGWPTNGTDVPLEKGQKHMYMMSLEVEGGGERTVKLPGVDELLAYRAEEKAKAPRGGGFSPFGPAADDTEMLRANLKVVGVSAARIVGDKVDVVMTHITDKTGMLEKPVDLWDRVADGCVTWNFPEGKWQVFVYFAGPNGNTSHMASREEMDKPNYILDHFAGGIYEYLDRHIGKGGWKDEYAGETLRAFFTDSFELSSPWTWTDNFFEEFERRRGYDLRPYLMCTSVPGCDSMFVKMSGVETPPMYDIEGVGDRIRHDYQLTIADIFDDYFMGELKKWGDDNKMLNRVQCYGHSMDNIKAFGRTHIPETEQLAGNGTIDFMKQAGSAALLYGKKLATAESLVWIRHDYMTTPTKMKVAADRLFVSGVNQLIYHGMPYRHSGMAFPHFYPFHGAFGSFMCRDNTLWKAIGQMNGRIARGQYLMQAGPVECDVAVFCQKLDYVAGSEAVEELTAGVLPGFDRNGELSSGHGNIGPSKISLEQQRGNRDFHMSHVLMEAGYDYFHINEECLLAAELIGGCLMCGDAKFRAIIINGEEKIGIEAAYRLRSLMDAGFPVIFVDCVPARVPGFLNYEKQEAELAKLFDGVEAVAMADAPAALAAAEVLANVECSLKCIQHIRRSLGENTLWFVRSSDYASHVEKLLLRGAAGGARILDTQTGDVIAPEYDVTADGISIELPFAAYGSWFILTGEALPEDTGGNGLALAFAACGAGDELPVEKWLISGKNAVEGGQDAECIAAAGDWADNKKLAGFSGEAVYSAMFEWNGIDGSYAIDLGKVGDCAEIKLNGVELGAALTAPFIFDVKGALKRGTNEIEIRVTNTLRNALVATEAFKGGRIIGGPGPRELAMSGICGPVTLKKLG